MPLIKCDLKQIEVCCFAQLCKDEHLISLINQGVDLHRYTASMVLDKDQKKITDLERKDAKQANFGIIYGNGAQKLSLTTGRDLEWCKSYIEGFYEMFPKARLWHNYIQDIVNRTGELQIFTGTRIKFQKWPAKYEWQIKKGIKESYNPPDIKNHPVQHLAFVLYSLFVSDLWRQKALLKRDKYLLINTVHDDILLDCKEEFSEECKKDLTETIDKLPNLVYNVWNERLLVPIGIDISVGETWLEL